MLPFVFKENWEMLQITKRVMAPVFNHLFNLFPKKGATILSYHQVVPFIQKEGLLSPSEYISTELFEKHLIWLKKKYEILPLSELLYRHKNGLNIDRTISITIDDGWRNAYTQAFPLLNKYQVPATIFLTTDFIGSKHPIWFSAINRIIEECKHNPIIATALIEDKLVQKLSADVISKLHRAITIQSSSKVVSIFKTVNSCIVEEIINKWSVICSIQNKEFIDMDDWLNWEEIHEMENSGLIEFGPHGDRHYFFTTISEEKIFEEIVKSWKKIDSKLNKKTKCFCYPGGLYNIKHINILEKALMESAVTFSGGKLTKDTPFFQIPRNGVSWKSHCKAYSLYNLVECVTGYYKQYPLN